MLRKFRLFCLALLVVISLVSCSSDTKEQENPSNKQIGTLVVSYIDVGQGDSILLECDNQAMLIDAGENDKGEVVLNYLNSRNIEKLKYAVGTHPHSDHIGGMDTVMEQIPADTFIYPDCDYNTNTWNDVLDVARSNKSKMVKAVAKNSYSLGEATFTIYAPQVNSVYSDCNNYSVVIRLTYGDNSFLFTGDAEDISEKEMIRKGYYLKSDVLKVGHHGSRYSSCDDFLNYVDPQYAVVSCGKNNDYGHPHRETMEKLNERGILTYRTDSEGTVVFTSDGENVEAVKGNSVTYEEIKTEYTTSEINECTVYIGNKNSLKLHKPECNSVKAMNEENKVYFDDREDAIAEGYLPCGHCKP